jgi:hypothetical protein
MRRKRFDSQIAILLSALRADSSYRTLAELHAVTGICETSLSAQLRNLRKAEHGGYAVSKRLNGERRWEYRLGD